MTRVHRLLSPDGRSVNLVGGILGLEDDAAIVRAEFERERPTLVLLGVPFEDLDAVRATAGRENEAEFDAGDLDDAYLQKLSRFGRTRSPPPDLYEAYQLAERFHVATEPIDLGDEAYTEAYTTNVGMLEVLRSNRRNRHLPARDFEAANVEDFALQWDDALYPTKGLQRVQSERSNWMKQRIEALAPTRGSALALLPLPRAIAVFKLLRDAGWRVVDGHLPHPAP